MLTGMKLSTKIASLAAILILLAGVVAFVGYNGMTAVVKRVEKADDVNRLVKLILATRQQEKNFIMRGEKKYADAVNDNLSKLYQQVTETKEKFNTAVNKQQMDKVLVTVGQYEEAFREFTSLEKKQSLADAEMVKNARNLIKVSEEVREKQKKQYLGMRAANASDTVLESNLKISDDAARIIRLTLEARRQEKNFILRGGSQYIERVARQTKEIINLARAMKTRVKKEESTTLLENIISATRGYQASFDRICAIIGEKSNAEAAMVNAARASQKACNKARAGQKALMEGRIAKSVTALIIGTIASIGIGALFSFFLIRGITNALNKIIGGVREGAEQVASASGQVSSASQSLAEGASEQAASIEETSASLEEMSSMTAQNADSAGQANILVKEANRAAAEANESMQALTGSMEEISKASEETSKIIKTIDEIAFQTNLLALNAAVEAARAGEAGAGFAVVAEEVRNLAMRSADAAKNTSGLIEGTLNKVNGGSGLVTRTNEAFIQVAESAAKVGELVAEIAAASNEQAQGIGQVNIAVTEMDKVTQQNAANAEESASASEEMNAQAEQMKSMVEDLMALVGGSSQGRRIAPDAAVGKSRAALTHKPDRKPMLNRVMEDGQSGNPNPKLIIPLEDDDFHDF